MVLKWDVHSDGVLSERALRNKMEKLGYQVTRYVYGAGTFFPDHTHEVDKLDAVVSGRFRIETPQGPVILGKGDMLEVPVGMVHNARVLGDESVVSFDGVRV